MFAFPLKPLWKDLSDHGQAQNDSCKSTDNECSNLSRSKLLPAESGDQYCLLCKILSFLKAAHSVGFFPFLLNRLEVSRFKVVSQKKKNSICFNFLVVFVDLFIYVQWSGAYSWDDISPAMSVVEFRAGRHLKSCMTQMELENPEPVLKDVWPNCSWMLPSRRFPSCPCRPFHCLAVFTIRQVFYCLN